MTFNAINKILGFLVWSPIILLSLLLAFNTLTYYSFDTSIGFLSEKAVALKDDFWVGSFFIHVTFGIPCLLLPVFQFSKRLLKKNKSLHVKIGNWYSYLTLFVVAPTGMYMSLYAKEGFWSELGFFLTGVILSLCTYWGIKSMRKGDLKGHVEWMTRSYAVSTSALTFRVLHLIFYYINLDYHFNYIMSLWLSLILNLIFAEVAIIFLEKKFKLSINK